jgi:hypothetical protein
MRYVPPKVSSSFPTVALAVSMTIVFVCLFMFVILIVGRVTDVLFYLAPTGGLVVGIAFGWHQARAIRRGRSPGKPTD